LNGHFPAGEVDELGTSRSMLCNERCALHGLVARRGGYESGSEKSATLAV
jgi:hypothetical protein